MQNGQLTLNGVTDVELVKVLEIKAKAEGAIAYTGQMQNAGGNPQRYNGVVLNFSGAGLAAIAEIVKALSPD